MNMQHEIISFDPSSGSIQVRYFCEDMQYELTYSIDIPLEGNTYPAQDAVQELIEITKPVAQFVRFSQLKTAQTPDWLMQFVPPPYIEPVLDTSQPMIDGVDELPQ